MLSLMRRFLFSQLSFLPSIVVEFGFATGSIELWVGRKASDGPTVLRPRFGSTTGMNVDLARQMRSL